MCTVTFIPSPQGVYLSSNRDEHHSRGRAVLPAKRAGLLYPKDKDAGGSWIAAKDNGDAAVLLNGAFTKHVPAPPYRRSRGMIFLEIIQAAAPYVHFNEIDLSAIEPFTIVIFSRHQLYECRWDGAVKHALQLDATAPHIWSSATLYDAAVIKQKERSFKEWLAAVQEINRDNILQQHRSFVIQGAIKTVSITSVYISSQDASLSYLDMQQQLLHQKKIPITASSLAFKTLLIKLFNREYWPSFFIYAPLYPYWLWLSIKARSFFFFSTSNPLIENAGFLLEGKKKIYDLMPAGSYPATIFCKAGSTVTTLKLTFPLIAKPDIGQQGQQVKLLLNGADLLAYASQSKVDFLLQEFIDYNHEVGIFYYRIPGESKGHISGIVGKELLAVIGDGSSTIEELLLKDDRYILQLSALRAAYGLFLHKVLPAGVSHTLVPYGNHSRGAKFIDLSHLVNEELTTTIDAFCQQIPQFYYGRLDIKYKNWEDLCAGKHFSVIELNGAGSEPTHIYDPSHSILFVWKEIIRHWQLLYRISQANAGIGFMSTREGLKMLKDYSRYAKILS